MDITEEILWCTSTYYLSPWYQNSLCDMVIG